MWNDLKTRVLGLLIARTAGEEGQALVEYGLILALVSVVCIVALGLLGTGINGILTEVVGKL